MTNAEDASVYWCDHIPEDVWVLGLSRHPMSIECLLDVLGEDAVDMFPREHISAFSELCPENIPAKIPWRWVLGDKLFMKRLNHAIEKARLNVCALENSNYEQTYKKIRKFLLCLKQPHIDIHKVESYIHNNDKGMTVETSLRSFVTEGMTIAPPIVYDQAGTATGRLTVKRGPRILTLPSRYRDIIKPNPGCEIVQIDLVSAEPRTALYVAGKDATGDVYKRIADDLNLDLPRDIVKVASLSALYGAGSNRLADLLGSKAQAKRVIASLKRYFGVERVESQLINDMKKNGFISNLFGRKLMTRHDEIQKSYNHFIQSTTSDAAICMFSDVCDIMIEQDENFKPFYVIHDAMVCEVSTERKSNLENMTKHLNLGGVGLYETKMTSVNDN